MSDRSSKEIEKEIESDRSDLDSTLSELSDRFDPDYLVRQVGTHLRENGADIGRSIQRSVKENPLALAVTGIGLGWLMFGQGRDLDADRRAERVDHAETPPMRVSEPVHPATRPIHRNEPDWARPSPDEFVTPGDFAHMDDDDDYDDNDDSGPGMMARASDSMTRAGAAVSDRSARMRSGAKARAAAARARSERMQARLSRGTEDLSNEARDRVVRAREQAMHARDAAARGARRGADKAADFFEEQPLVVGAIALAIGAAFAGSLPRSRTEDRYLGAQSDGLMEEAERIFHEERRKVMSVADAVADEARTIVDEEREKADQSAPGDKSAVAAIREEAEDAARRVRDRATDEADRQDLGKPNT